jgi:GDP-4-dehydro-6-deoxy-D-mannose reductase
MTTILVTGADGFIAAHIIARLAAQPDHRLVTVARKPAIASANRGPVHLIANLADAGSTRETVDKWKPDVVIHAAGRRGDSERELWRDNVQTARAVLDAVAATGSAAHVILFGSAAEYGTASGVIPTPETAACHPLSAYGRAKLAVTEDAMARAARGDLRVTVLRPFNPIGIGIPRSYAIGAFLEQIRHPRTRGDAYVIKMGPRDDIRDFFAVDDLVTVVTKVIERNVAGEIINVCTGRGRTLDELIARMTGLAATNVIFEDDNARRNLEATVSIGDCSKSFRLLGFAPSTDLDATLRAMWQEAVARRAQARA